MTSIELSQVSFDHGNQILDSIDLSIEKGEFVILMGPNGSGKSTLLKLINGSLSPSSGQARVAGLNLSGRAAHIVSQKVATLNQNLEQSTFTELSVLSNMILALSRSRLNMRKPQIEAYLTSFCPLLAERLDVQVGNLSGGQRQSLALAMCFANHPEILLLDEHTSALDPRAAAIVMRLTHDHVKETRLTTVMITHSLDQALQFGTRLIAMNEGKIVADLKGSKKLALSKEELIQLVF